MYMYNMYMHVLYTILYIQCKMYMYMYMVYMYSTYTCIYIHCISGQTSIRTFKCAYKYMHTCTVGTVWVSTIHIVSLFLQVEVVLPEPARAVSGQ